MAQDWDIRPRGEACGECNTPFEDKQSYHAMLVFGDDGYSRADFCNKCWPGKSESTSSYSTWTGVFRADPPKAEEPLKKETAEELLRALIEKDDAANQNVIYILAVMLERKRILVERDVKHTENSTVRIYEHRKTGETFVITDPELKMDQIQQVQQEVILLLSTSTVGPVPEQPPAEPAAAVADPVATDANATKAPDENAE